MFPPVILRDSPGNLPDGLEGYVKASGQVLTRTLYPQSPPWVTVAYHGWVSFFLITNLLWFISLTIFFVSQGQHQLISYLRERIVNKRPVLPRVASFDRREPTSAYCDIEKPFFLGASENPYPGRLNATTWKLGWSGDPWTRRGRILRTSMKLPGPIRRRRGEGIMIKNISFVARIRGVALLTSVNKQKRCSTLGFTLLVHIVDVELAESFYLNVLGELRQLIV